LRLFDCLGLTTPSFFFVLLGGFADALSLRCGRGGGGGGGGGVPELALITGEFKKAEGDGITMVSVSIAG